jgi:hypothetical protein
MMMNSNQQSSVECICSIDFSKPMHGWPNSELHDSIQIEAFQACAVQSRPTHRLTAYSFPLSGNCRLIRPSCGYPLHFRGSRDISATHGKMVMVAVAPHNDVPTGPSHWHLIKESAHRLPQSTSSNASSGTEMTNTRRKRGAGPSNFANHQPSAILNAGFDKR